MNIGFELRDGHIGHSPVRYLSFTWDCGGRERTLEVSVSADADFAALQLHRLAEAIEHNQRLTREKDSEGPIFL